MWRLRYEEDWWERLRDCREKNRTVVRVQPCWRGAEMDCKIIGSELSSMTVIWEKRMSLNNNLNQH